MLLGSGLESDYQNWEANNDEKLERFDPLVDTRFIFGINYKASLITAITGKYGRIIKNLQPISMGV